MKLSAILVSVNIAATIPVAMCQMAQASEEGSKETGDWLKSSLAALEKSSSRKAVVTTKGKRKYSLSDHSAMTPEIKAEGIKLRPFVPNRKLPRRQDLEMPLVAQTPTLAPDAEQLAGQVSEYGRSESAYGTISGRSAVSAYSPERSSSRIDAPKLSRQMVNPRSFMTQQAVPNQMQAAPRPIVTAMQKVARMPKMEMMQRAAEQVHQHFQPQQFAAAQPDASAEWLGQPNTAQGEQMVAQSGALLAPMLAPNDQALVDQMVDQAQMEIVVAQQQAEARRTSAGPPPFPLNLLPEDQLRNLVQKRPTIRGPKSYFGSWHQVRILPRAGFSTNLHGTKPILASNFGHYSYVQPQPHTSSHEPAAVHHRSHSTHHGNAKHSAPHAVQNAQVVKIAAYPPYMNYGGRSSSGY